MAQEALRLRIRIDGAREILRGFRRLPPDASRQLRERTLILSETLAARVRAAASSDSPQSALVASTVKARKDRVPSIQAGSSKKVGRNRKPAHKILFGSEFGSNVLKQFRPHRGASSYWFYKTVEESEAEIAENWRQLAAEVAANFAPGTGSN